MNKNETQKTDKETISKKDSLNQAYDPMVGHPKRKLILAVMCLSLIVTVLDNSILNVAIPTISETLKANDTDLIWIIDAYTIVFAGLLLTCGTLGDKFGRRLALQSGLFIFGAASFASSALKIQHTKQICSNITGNPQAYQTVHPYFFYYIYTKQNRESGEIDTRQTQKKRRTYNILYIVINKKVNKPSITRRLW